MSMMLLVKGQGLTKSYKDAPLGVPLKVARTASTGYLNVGDIIIIFQNAGGDRYVWSNNNNKSNFQEGFIHAPGYDIQVEEIQDLEKYMITFSR